MLPAFKNFKYNFYIFKNLNKEIKEHYIKPNIKKNKNSTTTHYIKWFCK